MQESSAYCGLRVKGLIGQLDSNVQNRHLRRYYKRLTHKTMRRAAKHDLENAPQKTRFCGYVS